MQNQKYEITPENIPPALEDDERVVLWRYMTFSSLCEILKYDHIPMISVSNFSDKSEGVILKEVISKLPDTYEESIEFAMHQYRRSTYISSWHRSESENATMWDRYTYGSEGVAIKTNAKLLLDCIRSVGGINIVGGPEYAGTMGDSTPNVIKINVGYVIRSVEYTDKEPSSFEIQEKLLYKGYDKMCFFYKMEDFRDEAEVRILHSKFMDPFELAKRRPSDIPDFGSDENTFKNSSPLRIISATKLIQQVVTSPYAHENFINTVKQVIGHIIHSKNRVKAVGNSVEIPIDFEIVESRRKNWV